MGVFCFGLTLPFKKEIVQEIPPIFMGWSRPFFAGLIALLFLCLKKDWKFPSLKDYRKYFWVILGIVFGFPFFSSLAMGKITASHGGVLLALIPIGIALAGTVMSKERPSLAFWGCCLIGSSLVVFYSLRAGLGEFQIGDIYMFMGVFLVSLGYAGGSILSQKIDGVKVITYALILGMPISFFQTFYYFPENFFQLKFSTYFYYFYVVAISQYGGFFFFYRGAALIGVAKSGMLHLLQPFVVIFVAFIFFENSFDLFTVVITALVITTVYFSRKFPVYQKE